MAENKTDFDVAIIGGGPGGYVAAIRAAQLGLRAALVERDDLGGICLNWGCIPTKTLLHSASVLRTVREAASFGVQAELLKADLGAMVARSRSVAERLRRGVAGLMSKHRVTVVKGTGVLQGEGEVRVVQAGSEQRIKAKHIILATGARPRVMPGLEVDGATVWSYREALTPAKIPRSLVVIGAGAIGVEFASFYLTMGSKVTLVEAAERILPVEDEEVSAHVAKDLSRQGMTLKAGRKVSSSEQTATGRRLVLEATNGSAEQLEADVVLVAIGIEGNVEGLGLESTRVRTNRSHIVVDSFCQTDDPGIYAIGDVAGPPWLAHKASHEGVLCVEKIAGLHVTPIPPNSVPSCTFGHPQVASVGLTEAEARRTGAEVKVGKFPFSANGMAIATGVDSGFVKTIFDKSTGELLGAHLVGEGVAELIHSYVVARKLETTAEELIESVFPHPTLSEALHESVLSANGEGLHY